MAIRDKRIVGGNGINYTKECDSSSDYAAIPNNTYFKDLSADLIKYKDPSGEILEIFSSGAGGDLQSAYDISPDGTITTDATRGAVKLKGGTGVGTNNIQEYLNNADEIRGRINEFGEQTAYNGFGSFSPPGNVASANTNHWQKLCSLSLSINSGKSFQLHLIRHSGGNVNNKLVSAVIHLFVTRPNTVGQARVVCKITNNGNYNLELTDFEILFNSTTHVISIYNKVLWEWCGTSCTLINNLGQDQALEWDGTWIGPSLSGEVNDAWVEKDITVGPKSLITDITYADLKTLYDGNTMVKGYYRITDFTTIYEQPDFDVAGVPKVTLVTKTAANEPIIVFAISNDKLSPIAYQEAYPKDRIQYDITWNTTERGNPAKGRISERIDEFNNRTDYDHRTVLFKRYESAPASGVFSVVNDNGGATFERLTFSGYSINNDLGIAAVVIPLYFGATYPILSNNIIGNASTSDTSFGLLAFNNTFLVASISQNQFGVTVASNTLVGSEISGCRGNNFQGNTFANITAAGNDFGNNFQLNICNGFMYDNVFISLVNNNTLASNFNKNTLDGFTYNTTLGSFEKNRGVYTQYNTFGNNFSNNDLGDSFGYIGLPNVIGINCKNNKFLNGFSNNTVGADVESNIFGSNVQGNTIGNGFKYNTVGHQNTAMNIGINFINNKIGDSNDLTVIGINCSKNVIGNNNYGVVFGEECSSIVIGNLTSEITLGNNCFNNKFGNQCGALTIPSNSNQNTFGVNNTNVTTFSAALNNNDFGNGCLSSQNFAAATHVYQPYYCKIDWRQDGTPRLVYMDNLDVNVVTNINA